MNTKKEILEEFDEMWTGLEAMKGLHPNYSGRELVKSFLSSAIDKVVAEVIEDIPKVGYLSTPYSHEQLSEVKQKLKSKWLRKETP